MPFIKKRVTYMLIVEDEDLAKYIHAIIDQRRKTYWKWFVKYYNDTDEEPYMSTSETNKG